MLIINPGSKIGDDPKGWTNTHTQARKHAYEWFYKPMQEDGFTDIEVEDTKEERDGRWLFIFKHSITEKQVELEVHGIDNLEAYRNQHIFSPRVYWNGSSSSNPSIDDFAVDGFTPVLTYIKDITPPFNTLEAKS